jgi:hypothetical protein
VKDWYARVVGLEFEPERGARCTGILSYVILCFVDTFFYLLLVIFILFDVVC